MKSEEILLQISGNGTLGPLGRTAAKCRTSAPNLQNNFRVFRHLKRGFPPHRGEFIRELAVEAGYDIAWDLVTQDEMLTPQWQVFTKEVVTRLQQS